MTRQHGQLVESPLASVVTATIHPSAILRARDEEERGAMRAMMVADLGVVAERLNGAFRGSDSG